MASLTDDLKNLLADHIFRGQEWAAPSSLFFGLTVSGTEVSGGSYARVELACNLTNWNATQGGTGSTSSGTGGFIDTAVDIQFPDPTGDWGTVDGYGIYDSSASGTKLIEGSLTASATINSGDPGPLFSAGDFDCTLS